MTNLQQLATQKDVLNQLEEDLYKPFQAFTPKSSLEGVVAPRRRLPPPSAIQSKRAKELLERRRDWIFMTPEDMLSAPTVEQILKVPDFQTDPYEKQRAPALERYYQGMMPKRSAKPNPLEPKEDEWFRFAQEPRRPEVAPEREELNLPGTLQASAEALLRASGSGRSDSPFGGGAASSSFSDPFRLGSQKLSEERLLEHKKLMEEYRTLVAPSWRPSEPIKPVAPAFSLADAIPTAPNPTTPLPTVAIPTLRRIPTDLPDPANPVLGPPPIRDLNAQAVGQSASAAATANLQPRRVAPRPPDFTAPKRAF